MSAPAQRGHLRRDCSDAPQMLLRENTVFRTSPARTVSTASRSRRPRGPETTTR